MKFLYREGLFSGADLLSVGVASFGHINGVHYQNQADFDPYLAKVNAGELPIFRAMAPTAEERMIRELVLQLKLGHVSRGYFQRKFGVDLTTRFASQIGYLRQEGFATLEGDTLRLNREALLQIDGLLHAFFLPAHQGARYA